MFAILMAALALAGASAKARADVAQQNSINQQNQIQAQEIADSKSVELQDALDASRRQRALINVASGDAGVNTNSQSVEAQLMDSLYQEGRTGGLIIKSARTAQQDRQMQAQSAYNQFTPDPGWYNALKIAGAYASAYNFKTPPPKPPSGGASFAGAPDSLSSSSVGGLVKSDQGGYRFGPPSFY